MNERFPGYSLTPRRREIDRRLLSSCEMSFGFPSEAKASHVRRPYLATPGDGDLSLRPRRPASCAPH